MISQFGWRFTRPTILIVGTQAWGRAQWDSVLPESERILFVECPADAGTIVIIVLILGLALAGYLLSTANTPDTPGIGKTVYSFNTGSNQLRLGAPFVEHFGLFRAYPDLAQQSYIQNIDNDQYLYFFGILGVGQYVIDGVFVENTPLTDYADSTYNILAPGVAPTLIPNLVWTCNEVSNQELKADWITYVVSAPLTEVDNIEYDISFPGGLVHYNKKGHPGGASVTVQTEVRTVDDLGVPTSSFVVLETRTFSSSSKDPLRFSRKIAAPLGTARYEFRVKRSTVPSSDSRTMDRAVLSGLRGYGAPHPDYGDLTMIEAKIKATDQLNGSAASQINIVATRKLGAVSLSGISGTLTATRSIVDAAAYMVTAENAGQQSVSILDLTTLTTLRSALNALSYYFDYRFTDRTSVMSAAAKAAICGRSVPCLPGGRFSLIKNDPGSPICAFSGDNSSDLEITVSSRTPDSPTCVLVSYIDPDTWDEENVFCFDGDGSEDIPLELKLDGCTNRQQAFEIGMFVYLQDKLERTTVSFSTGLMGYIPPLLSKVVVPNKNTTWGASGLIAAVVGTEIWLSEPIDFNGASEGKLYITVENGAVAGPFTVEPTEFAHCVRGTIASLKTIEANDIKAMRWIFGVTTDEVTDLLIVRVASIKPQGRDTIKIVGQAVNSDVYGNVGLAPPLGVIGGATPLLSGFTVMFVEEDSVGDFTYRVTWSGSAPKVRIEVNEGAGYVVRVDLYTSHNYTFTVSATSFSIKVTPYNSLNVLQTGQAQTQNIASPAAPTGLVVTQDSGDNIVIDWNNYTGAAQFFVSLQVDDEEIDQEAVSVSNFTITWADIQDLGGPWPEYTILVWAVLSDGQITLPVSTTENWNS